MQTLERIFRHSRKVISISTPTDIRRLEHAFQRLTREQLDFARNALQRARLERLASVNLVNYLQHAFEKWWVHDLTTKLAIIARVTDLAGSSGWPDGPNDVVNATIDRTCSAAAPWLPDAPRPLNHPAS